MVASANRKQCIAVTKKGTQCKLYALPGKKVCHVHIKTNINLREQGKLETKDSAKSNTLTSLVLKNIRLQGKENYSNGSSCKPKTEFGNIYVFTYAHMMYAKPTQMKYLNLAEPTHNNRIDLKRVSLFDPSDKILIKVGFTRKRPELRIKEWREQCGHSEFILLYPGCLVPIYKEQSEKKKMKTLEKLFRDLKIRPKESKDKKSIISEERSTGKKYKNLNQEATCFVSPKAYLSEQNIHKILREKYGSGKLFCEGCARHKINSKNQMVKTIGVHTEWFLVPRNEMHVIWDIIESQCVLYENFENEIRN